MKKNAGTFERWIWIELIGFDNTKPDYGVSEYLDEANFVPEAVSILMGSSDFIHLHAGMDKEVAFPLDYPAHRARAVDEKGKVQTWTNYQLRGLIEKLHDRGIKVFFSSFAGWYKGDQHHIEWMGKHPEVLGILNNGRRVGLFALKRFSDGSYYEDFLARKLLEVIDDYGFDGWHAADGYSPPPGSYSTLHTIDYSDDMVEQFLSAKGLELPEEISIKCESDLDSLRKRSDWIWSEKRLDWVEFHADRWASFWGKISGILHIAGKKLMLNSAWAKDPFESIYRYGIDYRKIIASGVDGFVVEAVGASHDMLGFVPPDGGGARETHHEFVAMLMLIRACVPDAKLIFLHGVKDNAEQWDLIHHAPTALEKEVCTLTNVFYHRSAEEISKCSEGLMVCLGNDIKSDEWIWLNNIWEIGFSNNPVRLLGPAVVWSDEALKNQLGAFISDRGWTTHRITHVLMKRGVPIQSCIRSEQLETFKGAILVPNPELMHKDEIEEIFSYRGGPIVAIGGEDPRMPEPDFRFDDVYPPNAMACSVYGLDINPQTDISRDIDEKMPADFSRIDDTRHFMDDLYFRHVSEDFLSSCARILCEATGYTGVFLRDGDVKVWMMEMENNIFRIFLKNDSYSYAYPDFGTGPKIDMGREIDTIKVITKFPVAEILPEGSVFTTTVPNKGIVILDVKLKMG